ncbi:MAG TPA: hypothetical protein PKA91_03405, partial [Leptospiraceae bacterium]|nr:hypothetical protein [Leptospiraceae bacterium]
MVRARPGGRSARKRLLKDPIRRRRKIRSTGFLGAVPVKGRSRPPGNRVDESSVQNLTQTAIVFHT